jgi:hypothetical protein
VSMSWPCLSIFMLLSMFVSSPSVFLSMSLSMYTEPVWS